LNTPGIIQSDVILKFLVERGILSLQNSVPKRKDKETFDDHQTGDNTLAL